MRTTTSSIFQILPPPLIGGALAIFAFASSSCWPKPQVPNNCSIAYERGSRPVVGAKEQCWKERDTWQMWQDVWFSMDEPELWAGNDDKVVFRVARHDTYIGLVTVYRAEIQNEKGTVVVRRLNGFWQTPVMTNISKRELDESEVEVISDCIASRSEWRFASELMNFRHGVDWIVEASERGSYALTMWATGNRRESEEPEELEKCFNYLVLIGSTWW